MSNLSQTYETLRSSQKFQKRFGVAIRLVVALFLIFAILAILFPLYLKFCHLSVSGSWLSRYIGFPILPVSYERKY